MHFTFFCLTMFSLVYPQSHNQTAVLNDLYYATEGDHWINNNNWLQGDPCSNSWFGVECDDNRNITGLFLPSNELRGTIPDSIGNLYNLHLLHLDGNELSQTIPNSLGNLSLLQYLYLNDNEFSGTIPDALGNLSWLLYLYLNDNELVSPLPSFLQHNPGGFVRLQNNKFTCPVPFWCGADANSACLPCTNRTFVGSPSISENNSPTSLFSLSSAESSTSGASPGSSNESPVLPCFAIVCCCLIFGMVVCAVITRLKRKDSLPYIQAETEIN